MRKKFIAVVLAAALACNMTGMTAAAQPAVAGLSVLKGLLGQNEGGGNTGTQNTSGTGTAESQAGAGQETSSARNTVTLDIGKGDIIIGKSGITAVDTAGNPVTTTSSEYVITGSTEEHAIVVDEGVNANIVLSNVSIVRTMDRVSPLRIADNSSGLVRVRLEGSNTLQGGNNAAGIQKNCMHAGSYCKCGTLEITSVGTDGSYGTLNATGTNGAAGIGGGSGMGSSRIDIKGGIINTDGGIGGASGGIGKNIEIKGGLVNVGSLNGTDGGIVLNGNAVLIADSIEGLDIKKGIVYQNGEGTVYGKVELPQELANSLPADGTLNIPTGARLTVDESVTLPNADQIVGSDNLVVKKAPTATPTAAPEETVTAQAKAKAPAPAKAKANSGADVAMASAVEEEVQSEAQAKETVPGQSSIAFTILNSSGGALASGASQKYGNTIKLHAEVSRYNNPTPSQNDSLGSSSVRFYVGEDRASSLQDVRVNDRGIAEFSVTLTASESLPNIEVGGELTFSAQYMGDDTHGKSPESSSIAIRIERGDLFSDFTEWKPDADAGIQVKDINTAPLSVANGTFNPNVRNAAGQSVPGKWEWVSGNEILWPGTTGSYNLRYVLTAQGDEGRYLNYGGTGTGEGFVLVVRPNIIISKVNGDDYLELTKKSSDNEWYNVETATNGVEVSAKSGYRLLLKTNVSSNGWADSEWVDKGIISNKYYNGDYEEIYVRDGTGKIMLAVLKDFKVDRYYPLIKDGLDGFDYWADGESVRLVFNVGNEIVISGEGDKTNGSGVSEYICQIQQRSIVPPGGILSQFNIPPNPEGTLSGRDVKTSSTGVFEYAGLNSNTTYDVYLIVRDNAGNETKYLKRVIGDNTTASGNKVEGYSTNTEFLNNEKPQGSPVESSPVEGEENNVQLHYGYKFDTDKANIEATVTLTVLDSDDIVQTDEVAYGDKIKATADIKNPNYGTVIYTWCRLERGDGKQPVPIDGVLNADTYVLQPDDIDKYIVCQVKASNTASMKDAIAGPVQRAVCPEEYMPHDGKVDDVKDIFTFSGISTVKYEYCTDGGKSDEWTAVKSDGSANFTIEIGDVTILRGDLLVRTMKSDLYKPSTAMPSEDDFISSREMEIELEGEPCYGEVLTAKINSTAINSSNIRYEWSRNGSVITGNVGNTYELAKEDVGKVIQVKATLQGHEDISKTADTGPIGKRSVNAIISITAKEYDGTTEADAEVSFSGVINGDDLSSTASAEFSDKNAGEDKTMRSVKLGTINGELAYYDVKRPDNSTVKGTIRPKQLTLSMTAQDKVYDGTTNADVSFTTTAIPGDSISISGNGEFADKNVGTKKTVTSKDVTVIGTDAANYTAAGSTATATANITQKDISIAGITVADKTFDGTTDATIAVTFTGAADEPSYTYKAAFESPTVGMDKRVTAVITLAGDSAKNYKLANGNATGLGNIVKAVAPYEEANIPQSLTGVEGKKLSSVFIGIGFNWKEPNTVMEKVGKYTYDALYNPNPSQYGDREVRVDVLVQCAKHTWGDWTTSIQPTKTETGERRRICAVCGYVEVETVPRAPYIKNEDTKEGWGDIMQAINNASSGTEIPILMNGTETLPASVQTVLQGRDVSLVMQMADGITWTLRGQDITGAVLKDINMAVSLYTDNIPTDVLDPYTEGGKTAVQIHLAYSGEFGFTATLRVPLGNGFAGLNSTFYYYNPSRERLEQMDSNRITSDGIGRYDLTHASDYVTIIDTATRVNGGSASENTPTPAPGGNSGDNGNNNNNNDNNNGNASTSTNNTTGGSGAAGQTNSGTNSGTNTGTNSGTNTSANAARTTSGNARVLSINAVKTGDETTVISYMILLLCGAAGVVAIGAYRRGRRKERSR